MTESLNRFLLPAVFVQVVRGQFAIRTLAENWIARLELSSRAWIGGNFT